MRTHTKTLGECESQLSATTDQDLADLRAGCLEIVKSGGEFGEIAADILRVSTKLQELSEKADRALAGD